LPSRAAKDFKIHYAYTDEITSARKKYEIERLQFEIGQKR